MRSSRADGILVVLAQAGGQGGLQRRYLEQARRHAVHHPVTILTWGVTDVAVAAGVELVRARSVLSWGRDHHPALAAVNTAVSLTTAWFAAMRIRRQWGVVLAAGLVPEGLLAALVALPLRRSFVADTWLPGPLGNVARLRRSPLFSLERRVLARARALVAGTEELAEELTAAGFRPAQVHLVKQGLDLSAIRPALEDQRLSARRALGLDGRRVVAFWGRFDLRQKRVDVLLDAWDAANLVDCQLVLAGDGPDRGVVLDRATRVRGAPICLGWLEDVAPVLAAADLFVFPTNFEATGMAMIEGLAAGVPGIASKTSQLLRWKPAGTTLVPNDVDAWADALRWFASLSDADLRERGAAARTWVEQHTPDIDDTVARLASLLTV